MFKISMKLPVLVAMAGLVAGVAIAADQDVEVLATMRQAISLTKNLDVDFSSVDPIDFTGTPAGTDFVQLGSNGAITYAGAAFSGPSTGQAGDVDINGDGTSGVDISCTATATLAEAGGATITANQMQISMNTGDAFGSADYTCAGLGTTPHSYTLTGTDTILMGGRLVGNGTIIAGAYSTATGAGVAATVRVVYQ